MFAEARQSRIDPELYLNSEDGGGLWVISTTIPEYSGGVEIVRYGMDTRECFGGGRKAFQRSSSGAFTLGAGPERAGSVVRVCGAVVVDQ